MAFKMQEEEIETGQPESLEALAAANQQLKEELSALQETNAQLHRSNEEKDRELKSKDDAIGVLQHENYRVSVDNYTLNNEKDHLKNDNEGKARTIQEQTDEISQLRDESARLNKNNSNMQNQIERLEKQQETNLARIIEQQKEMTTEDKNMKQRLIYGFFVTCATVGYTVSNHNLTAEAALGIMAGAFICYLIASICAHVLIKKKRPQNVEENQHENDQRCCNLAGFIFSSRAMDLVIAVVALASAIIGLVFHHTTREEIIFGAMIAAFLLSDLLSRLIDSRMNSDRNTNKLKAFLCLSLVSITSLAAEGYFLLKNT